MIRFTLKCSADHDFETWFASGDTFESMRAAGHVTCPECGDANVEKALMAPRVPARAAGSDGPPERSLARLRREFERKVTYVGRDFSDRARAMHEGTETHRPIYGEAAPAEVRRLVEDGVPVAPLPFIPKQRTN